MLAARLASFAALHADARVVLRNVALPLIALLSSLLLPMPWLVGAFVVLGQAHFAMSMFYQVRAGKADARYIAILAIGLVAALLYFSTGAGFTPIFIVTVLCFAAHFSFDEFQLQKCPFGVPQKATFILFILLFAAMLSYSLLPKFALTAFALALLFPAYAATRIIFSSDAPTRAESYIWLVGVLLMVLAFGFSVEPVVLLAVISILHITNWYADYGRRLADSGNTARLRSYWTEVLLLIALMASLYTWYLSGATALTVLFNVMYYYAWALVHFALSAVSVRRPKVS